MARAAVVDRVIKSEAALNCLGARPSPCQFSEAEHGRRLSCSHQSACNSFVDAAQHLWRCDEGGCNNPARAGMGCAEHPLSTSRRRWRAESWHCGTCTAFEPMTEEARRRDTDALNALLGEALQATGRKGG